MMRSEQRKTWKVFGKESEDEEECMVGWNVWCGCGRHAWLPGDHGELCGEGGIPAEWIGEIKRRKWIVEMCEATNLMI